MDSKTIHDKFRHQLTNVHALTVLTVSLIEVVGYIILILSGEEHFSLDNLYLWYGVVFPITANAITHIVARAIVNNPSVSRQKKNQCIIAAALVTSFLVAIIHKEYIVTCCAFIFPIILSAIFNDKKLLNTSFLFSVLILIFVAVAFWLDNAISLTTALNLLVLFGLAFVSYLCGIISINFSRQNYTTIESQAKANDKLLSDVQKDQMTGLYNHSCFVNQLDGFINVFSPTEPLCLVMVDVDDFKHINDTYGHDCGDTVLIRLAKTLLKHTAKNGHAYRYGGEEFAILFVGQPVSEVCDTVQAILDEFSRCKFPFTDRSITFSAGVAQYALPLTRDEFFEQADKTLYTAKREGKNQVLKAKEPCAI